MLLPTRVLSVGRAYPERAVVFIPYEQLPERQHELPPPHMAVRLLNDTPEAVSAHSWLAQQGRSVEWADVSEVPYAEPSARYRLWEPNEFLVGWVSPHPPQPSLSQGFGRGREPRLPSPEASGEGQGVRAKTALDLGCGSGREAVYLAALDWQVTAVDRLPDALERGRDLQSRYAPQSQPIEWLCADLEDPDWEPPRRYDLIVNLFYFSGELLLRAWEWLLPNGVLLIEAFTPTHQQAFGRPRSPKRVVNLPSLINLLPVSTTLLHASADWRMNGRHTVRLLARRG